MKKFIPRLLLPLAALCACLALADARAPKPQSTTEGQAGGVRLYPILSKLKWGYMDAAGKTVVEPRYDNEGVFGDGLVVVSHGQLTEGLERVEPVGGMVVVPVGPEGIKWEIIDASGQTVAKLPPGRNYMESYFSEGLAHFSVWKEGQGSVYGYMDRTGQVVIKPRFSSPGPFREGLAGVCVKAGRCGFIDRKGKFVVPPKYGGTLPFSEGMAAVTNREELVGFVNKDGEEVIAPRFDPRSTSGFAEGLAAVAYNGTGKFGYIDTLGHFVIPPEFNVAGPFSEGLAAVMVERNKWGYIDRSGKLAIAPLFTRAEPFGESLAAASTCPEAGLSQYTESGEPSGCGFGYIDKSGAFVIEQRFDGAGVFRGGVAYVITAGGRGYIDSRGNLLWQQGR
jgi:WG containing repeat